MLQDQFTFEEIRQALIGQPIDIRENLVLVKNLVVKSQIRPPIPPPGVPEAPPEAPLSYYERMVVRNLSFQFPEADVLAAMLGRPLDVRESDECVRALMGMQPPP